MIGCLLKKPSMNATVINLPFPQLGKGVHWDTGGILIFADSYEFNFVSKI